MNTTQPKIRSTEEVIFNGIGILGLVVFALATWDLYAIGELSNLSFNMTSKEANHFCEAFFDAIFYRSTMIGIIVFFGGFALLYLIELISLLERRP